MGSTTLYAQGVTDAASAMFHSSASYFVLMLLEEIERLRGVIQEMCHGDAVATMSLRIQELERELCRARSHAKESSDLLVRTLSHLKQVQDEQIDKVRYAR